MRGIFKIIGMDNLQAPVGVFELADGLPRKAAGVKKHPA
jgi:hypothetical protein